MNSPSQHPQPQRGLLGSTLRFFGQLLLVGVFASAGLFALWSYAVRQADREIQSFFEQKLADHYSQFQVSVGSARMVENQGLEIHNISIRQATDDSSTIEVVHIGEAFIACPANLQDLLAGSLDVSHVTIRGLKVTATRQADGSFNAAQLFPLPDFADYKPTATIEDGVLQWIDPALGPGQTLALRELNMLIDPGAIETIAIETGPGDTQSFYDPVPHSDQQPESTPPGMVRLTGSFASDHFSRVEVDCQLGPQPGSWSAKGTVSQFRITPQLFAVLPDQWASNLGLVASLQGQLDLDFQLKQPLQGQSTPQFVVSGDLTDAQLTDPRLPAPLTDMRAHVYCDNHEFRIDQLTAQGGLGNLELRLRRQGLAADSPLVLWAKTRRFVLDSRIAEVLPKEMLATWDQFSPVGVVDAELNLTFDGQRWKPDLQVDCLDMSFKYYKFPYRLGRGVGMVHLKDGAIQIRLRALAAGQIVRIDGDIQNPGPDATGSVEIASEGPVPLDEKLLSALDAKSQQVVRLLRPRGMITVAARFERTDPRQPMADRKIIISLKDCAINYEKFPYPLTRISGTLEMTNGQWEFHNLEGYNDSGYVVCRGAWTTDSLGGGEMKLDFVATDVPLEDELRDALPAKAQQMWNQLRPRGSVDHMKIALRFDNATRITTLDVRCQKWKQKQNVESRSITVQPQWFPYRLDEVTGTISFINGQTSLSNISAMHGRTSVSLGGACQCYPTGNWKIRLDRLTADRLRLDHDLIAALPEKLGQAVAKLKLSGPINMQGSFEMSGVEDSSLGEALWDLTFDVENGSLDYGVQLDHIHGGVRLAGSHNASRTDSRGEITVDSLLYRNVQFSQVTGPFWIDSNGLTIGSWANRAGQRGPPKQVTAKVFGGDLSIDARITSGVQPEYIVQTTLAGADLKQFAQEIAPQLSNKISGTANAVLELRGVTQQPHTLRGGGLVRLRDANIYEVPFMLSLLKVLAIQQPDKTAFTTSDIDFDIQGNNIYFKRIDFNGDAISLKGQGEMNLDRRLNIHFYTKIGPDRVKIPIITPIISAASRQLLLIHAGGTLDRPVIKREALPGLNDTLQQIFSEPNTADSQKNRFLLTPREVLQRSGLLPR